MSPHSISAIAPALLAWYDGNARALPWRSPPGSPEPADPYRVWLSEVMLQQTTVAAVRPRFEAFVARWPDVAALAAAPKEEVLAAWAGLGYYARARNLSACARAVVADGGRFPNNEAELRKLPGLGAYTAAAIAAIAFGWRAVAVDTNVERVVARLFAVREPLPGSRPTLRALADRITPDARPGDFAQAMMDLGAGVCTPRAPRCGECPLANPCEARRLGLADVLPTKLAKAKRPRRFGTAYWLRRGDDVLLVRRPARGLLGGMRALPSGDWTEEPCARNGAPCMADWRALDPPVRHVFTHFALDLTVATARGDDSDLQGEWWPVDRLAEAGLPTLFAKAAEAALRAG